jgi:SAM-dependent methyltransferase
MSRPGFFDAFPRFVETSKTGRSIERLNARHRVLVERNRALFSGAAVLDLASHDGRFSFAALHAGAERVVGIEHDPELVKRAHENFEEYGIDSSRFRFECRDLYPPFDDLGRFDLVLCFGILYHINDHLTFLSNIAAVEPAHVLIDTHASRHDGAVIELRSPLGASPPPPGSGLEGRPSRGALDALTSTLGWEGRYVDWDIEARPDDGGIDDYLSGTRVSMVATCPDRIDEDVRRQAVALVFAHQTEPRWQWMAVKGISEHFGISPQSLRMWVRKAEREGRGPST